MVCLSANLSLPGLGSIVAGRRVVGYLQLVLAVAGTALTLVCGSRFILWAAQNWTRIRNPDSLDAIMETWQRSVWPLIGIGLFAVAWIWSLLTGYAIVRSTRATPPIIPAPPPHISDDRR
jgi:hypothetical protein